MEVPLGLTVTGTEAGREVVGDNEVAEAEEDKVEGRGEKDKDTFGLATLQNN